MPMNEQQHSRQYSCFSTNAENGHHSEKSPPGAGLHGDVQDMPVRRAKFRPMIVIVCKKGHFVSLFAHADLAGDGVKNDQ
jgi:hypothetical protein